MTAVPVLEILFFSTESVNQFAQLDTSHIKEDVSQIAALMDKLLTIRKNVYPFANLTKYTKRELAFVEKISTELVEYVLNAHLHSITTLKLEIANPYADLTVNI